MTNQAQALNVNITSRFWTRYLNMTVENALPYQWRALNDEVPVDVPEGAAWGENGSQFSHSLRNLRIAAGVRKACSPASRSRTPTYRSGLRPPAMRCAARTPV